MGMNSKQGNVLYIIPSHAFSHSILVDSGLQTMDPYKGRNRLFPRLFRELFFRLKLPGRRLFFNKPKQEYATFFIFEGLMIPEYIEWLHSQYQDSRYILFYMNKCTPSNSPELFNFPYLSKWSGDVDDCKKYGLHQCEKSGSYVRNWVVDKKEPKYDVFYVGKDKGRLDYLLDLEKRFQSIGLRTYFHIVPEYKFNLYRHREYKKMIPYREVLDFLSVSRAILCLQEGAQKTATIRVQESLVHKIKLITDCAYLKEYDFYHPDNIFILGEDKLENLPVFLDKPYVEMDYSLKKRIFFTDLVEEVLAASEEL